MSCCAIDCTNPFKRDAGIGFHTIPAKQVRREACLRAISRVGWEAKSSDRYCGEHFVSGRLSRDPKNVDCVPTLFKGGRRRVNCSIPAGPYGGGVRWVRTNPPPVATYGKQKSEPNHFVAVQDLIERSGSIT